MLKNKSKEGIDQQNIYGTSEDLYNVNKYILCYKILFGEKIKVDTALITQRTAG